MGTCRSARQASWEEVAAVNESPLLTLGNLVLRWHSDLGIPRNGALLFSRPCRPEVNVSMDHAASRQDDSSTLWPFARADAPISFISYRKQCVLLLFNTTRTISGPPSALRAYPVSLVAVEIVHGTTVRRFNARDRPSPREPNAPARATVASTTSSSRALHWR